jgi:hypothetical protein
MNQVDWEFIGEMLDVLKMAIEHQNEKIKALEQQIQELRKVGNE